MALPVLTASAGASATGGSPIVNVPITIPAGTNLIIVWYLFAFGPSMGAPAVILNGGIPLILTSFGGSAGLRQLGSYRLVGPGIPSGSGLVTLTAGGSFGGVVLVQCFTGVDTASPLIVGPVFISTSGSGSTIGPIGGSASDLGLDAVSASGVTGITPGGGQTQVAAEPGPAPHILYSSTKPGPTSPLSWTWSGFQTFVHGLLVVKGAPNIIVTPASAVAMSIVPLPTLTTVVRMDIDVPVVLTPDQDKEVHLQV